MDIIYMKPLLKRQIAVIKYKSSPIVDYCKNELTAIPTSVGELLTDTYIDIELPVSYSCNMDELKK